MGDLIAQNIVNGPNLILDCVKSSKIFSEDNEEKVTCGVSMPAAQGLVTRFLIGKMYYPIIIYTLL